MYCRNCGNEMNNSQKFCPKCGTPNDVKNNTTVTTNNVIEAEPIKKYSGGKKQVIAILSIVVVIVVAITIIFSVINANPKRQIVGTWEVNEYKTSEDVSFYNYPEDDFMIFDDGTMKMDGYSLSYSIEGDKLSCSLGGLDAFTYTFKVHGDTLELRDVSDDEGSVVYYDRVD